MVNVVRVPGKVVTCAAGAAVGIVLLVFTLASGYRAAAAITDEGWVSLSDFPYDPFSTEGAS